MTLLAARAVSKSFGGLRAIDGVSLEVPQGQIHALIGPNGSGKTTFLNLVTRIFDPDGGKIAFDGRDLLRVPPHDVIRLGISRIFQHVELFANLTVLDNAVIGAHVLGRTGLLASLVRSPSSRREEEEARRLAHKALAFVGLGPLADRPASALTGGQARLLGLARALVSEPRMILLDELVAGLNTQETYEAELLVRRLRDEMGVTVLLIEHDMRFVMSLADRISVLDFGRKIAEGTPDEIRRDPVVIEAYLGGGRYAHS